MQLRKRHASAVKPTVHYFGSTFHFAAALALDLNLIDIRLVQFDVAVEIAEFFEFILASYNFDLAAVFAYPYRKRCTPISLAGNSPVDDVLEEVAHTSRAYSRRHPVDGSVVFEKPVSDFRHLDKPARSSIIQKRSVASPAERIAVLEQKFLKQQTSLSKILDDELVPVLYEYALPFSHSGNKSASVVHHLNKRQIVFSAHLGVVLAECRRDMYDTRTVRKRDVRIVGDKIRFLFRIVGVVKRDIFFSLVFLAELSAQHFIFFKQRGNKRLGKHVYLAVGFYLHVILFSVHTQSDV